MESMLGSGHYEQDRGTVGVGSGIQEKTFEIRDSRMKPARENEGLSRS